MLSNMENNPQPPPFSWEGLGMAAPQPPHALRVWRRAGGAALAQRGDPEGAVGDVLYGMHHRAPDAPAGPADQRHVCVLHVTFLMLQQAPLEHKPFAAERTLEKPLSRVPALVVQEVILPPVGFVTLGALVGPLSRVTRLVPNEPRVANKVFPTVTANVGLAPALALLLGRAAPGRGWIPAGAGSRCVRGEALLVFSRFLCAQAVLVLGPACAWGSLSTLGAGTRPLTEDRSSSWAHSFLSRAHSLLSRVWVQQREHPLTRGAWKHLPFSLRRLRLVLLWGVSLTLVHAGPLFKALFLSTKELVLSIPSKAVPIPGGGCFHHF